jgi:outer membrane protein TolC
MRNFSVRKFVACGLCLFVSSAWAQQPAGATNVDEINPVRPQAPILWRPYRPVTVPPIRLGNSSRLAGLVRAGSLYLTARDAIALALENNIDIESGRYDASNWRVERAQAGGALPGVPSGASQTTSVASGQGVLGSQAAAGVSGGNNGGSAGTSNVTINQVGTVAQTFDPSIQEATTFSHRTLPQPNATASVTSVLIQNQRIYTGSYQEGFATGGSVNVSYNNHYVNENAPTDLLNPSVAPTVSIRVQHNFLQGFGIPVNTQGIRVAKMNVRISDLNFRTTVERTVVSVLNAYYSLVGDYEDGKSKLGTLETSRQFLGETKRRVDLGAAAQLDVTTAENEVSQAEQALVNSKASLQQDELQLKNLISRTGIGDAAIADLRIIPLDHIVIPAADDLPPLQDLVRKALANRSDLVAAKEGVEASNIAAIATINGLLPTGVAIASKSNAGIAGAPRVVGGQTADRYFVGGNGVALGQIFRNNFPSQALGAFVSMQAFDRVAQADYAVDQLQLRQQSLGVAKSMNQAQVDIANSVVALRQGRARYEAAVQNRILQQKLFEAEQKKFAVGESTTYNVTQIQRDLANAQASELSALVSWQSARISLDQTTGATLEANQVSIADAQSGKIAPAAPK